MRRAGLTEEERERYSLALSRIREVPSEQQVQEPCRSFFVSMARFLLRMDDLREALEAGAFEDSSIEELQELNRELYEDILPENYAGSFGNPDMTTALFGRETGQMISFIYAELRGAIVYAYEDREWDMLVLMEFFLEVYGAFAAGPPSEKSLADIIYWYCSDYSADFVAYRVREQLDASLTFAKDIVTGSDLSDLRYLYAYGEYVSDNELKTAAFMNSLSEEEIRSIAGTWTEGFRKGFEVQNKPLHNKKYAYIEYRLGFERMVRCAMEQLSGMGLETILYRVPSHAVDKRRQRRAGYCGTSPNKQYEYDHRNDGKFYIDERSVTRRLAALRSAYEEFSSQAEVYAGPVVLEVFGETPFRPEPKDSAPQMSSAQEKEEVRSANETMQIASRFIKMEERSFTIIAYPVPEIGDNYETLFRETVRINNLDYTQYLRIQQHLIDALDSGVAAHVLGRDGNETDMTVRFHKLEDPSKQTNFENCVADVNIPVGEVFTTPVLAGTTGLLHVGRAVLEGLRFVDLKIRVEDGMVKEYSCGNYDDPAQGRKYIDENIMFHHETLPVGEFAIGTNTTAYQVAQKYGIADILPILIAEKMGPHFAFGDTCYSWQEDVAAMNPDGKEVIARENECSALRRTDMSKAYFDCHTDVTIPYDELGSIRVIRADGSEIPLIENGRFVLPGTEELNIPLEGLI